MKPPEPPLTPSLSPSDGERILPSQVRALNPCNLALRKLLVIKGANLEFMVRVADGRVRGWRTFYRSIHGVGLKR